MKHEKNRAAGILPSLLAGLLATGAAAAESIGEVRLGITAAAVEDRLGRPEGIEEQPPECPGGPPLAVWDYSDRGLMLVVEGSGPTATLMSAGSFGESRLETERGVGIGATYEKVMAAYPDAVDPSPESFLADVDTGALEISFSGDKPPRVIRILLTSESTLVYQEGEDCGREED